MPAFKDLIGQTKGDWTVKRRIDPPEYAKVKNRPWYLLECSRGHSKICRGQDFSNGSVTKCHECMAIIREEKRQKKREETPTREQAHQLIVDQHRKIKLGEERLNNDGDLMKLIEYNGSESVAIEFQDEFKYRTTTWYSNFKKGTMKNPYHKLLYGRGYIGVGPYEQTINRKSTREYDMWRKMFDRCYSGRQPAYSDCDVCEEWYNFQNFAKWYKENYYEIDGQNMQVDKDWLCVGNRLYCPENCCIAPRIINACLLTHNKKTNFDLPTGIEPYNKCGKYKARCSVEGKRVEIGIYDTIDDAYKAYKEFKIKYVESLGEKFKDYIPKKLYDAVKNYRFTFDERSKFIYETVC